jgi:hypothetical protein
MLAGILNVVWRIPAIDSEHFVVEDERSIFSDLNTWAWIHPFWSLAIIGMDLRFVRGLSAYGGQHSRATT